MGSGSGFLTQVTKGLRELGLRWVVLGLIAWKVGPSRSAGLSWDLKHQVTCFPADVQRPSMIISLLNSPLDDEIYKYSMEEVSPAIFNCISCTLYTLVAYM